MSQTHQFQGDTASILLADLDVKVNARTAWMQSGQSVVTREVPRMRNAR